MRLADEFDDPTVMFDSGTAISSQLTSSKVASLEHLTSSTTSASFTESGYTPTDLQSAISGLNSTAPGLSSMYSNDMFEPFLSNIFSASTTIVGTPVQSSDTDTTVSDVTGEEAFPFATRPVDVQPFMASIEDEWFYEALVNPSMFAPAPTPITVTTPEYLPRISPFECIPPLPSGDYYEPPPIAEMQHYRNHLMSLFALRDRTNYCIHSLSLYLCFPDSSTGRPYGHMGYQKQAHCAYGSRKSMRCTFREDQSGNQLCLCKVVDRKGRSRS